MGEHTKSDHGNKILLSEEEPHLIKHLISFIRKGVPIRRDELVAEAKIFATKLRIARVLKVHEIPFENDHKFGQTIDKLRDRVEEMFSSEQIKDSIREEVRIIIKDSKFGKTTLDCYLQKYSDFKAKWLARTKAKRVPKPKQETKKKFVDKGTQTEVLPLEEFEPREKKVKLSDPSSEGSISPNWFSPPFQNRESVSSFYD